MAERKEIYHLRSDTRRARANVTFADQELADDDIHVLEPSSCTAVEPEPALDTEVTQDKVETDNITEESHSHLLDENESVPVEPGLGPVCEFEKFPRSAPLKEPMIGDGITRHDLGTEKSMKLQSTVGGTSSINQPEVTSHVAFRESQNSRTAATQYPQNKSKEMFMTQSSTAPKAFSSEASSKNSSISTKKPESLHYQTSNISSPRNEQASTAGTPSSASSHEQQRSTVASHFGGDQYNHIGAWGDFMSSLPNHTSSDGRRGYSTMSNRIPAEPRLQLPKFNGKGDWKAFLVQFEFLAVQYDWDQTTQTGYLMGCLEGPAMEFVARLPRDTRHNWTSLIQALDHRYGDHELPESYRATLQNLKKQNKEDLHEYAARVSDVVSKAYPGLEGTELHTNLTIEHIVNGLSDPSLVYDVLTKRPPSVEAALGMINWHECCKSMKNRQPAVRQVGQVGLVSKENFVTGEQLHSFGQELLQLIQQTMKGTAANQKIHNSYRRNEGNMGAREQQRVAPGNLGPEVARNIECFYCHDYGHVARQCPKKEVDGRRMAGYGGKSAANPRIAKREASSHLN